MTEAATEEHIAASVTHPLAATLRVDPEAGNLRFPVTPPFWGETRCTVTGFSLSPGSARARRSYDPRVADQENQPLAHVLEELGAQLDWVREYL